MTSTITLYDAHGSPCARRARAVLLEKGLAWLDARPSFAQSVTVQPS